MPINVLMPALSPTMTEGKLANWLKDEGDTIDSGDVIAEIETDKATMEVEAVDEGRLGKILVAAGTEGVAVNSVIAVILEEGEDAAALEGHETGAAPASAPAVPASVSPPAAEAKPLPPVQKAAGAEGLRVKASPLARRLAAIDGVDLAGVSGSGPRGRIVKRDVLAAIASQAEAPTAAAAPVPEAPKPAIDMSVFPQYESEPNSGMRKIIARRLSESKQDIPHFYLTVECEVDALLKIRKQLNAKSDAYKISVNDFVIRAASLALKKVPAANAMWTDDAILKFKQVDISVAVAIDGGLITPVIKDSGSKGLVEISDEMKALARKARDGRLMPHEYQGGTFSVSNLGMFGIKSFSAIVNPPQGAILAVGAGEQRPVVKDGQLAVATVMNCTLSVDHRVVDGAVGAEFMAEFKKRIEDPICMLL